MDGLNAGNAGAVFGEADCLIAMDGVYASNAGAIACRQHFSEAP